MKKLDTRTYDSNLCMKAQVRGIKSRASSELMNNITYYFLSMILYFILIFFIQLEQVVIAFLHKQGRSRTSLRSLYSNPIL